jgi:hypothetical protein
MQWTREMNQMLVDLVQRFPEPNWRMIALHMGIPAKKVRDHYRRNIGHNYAPWTAAEDDLLKRLVAELGHKWSRIASLLDTNRSQCDVRNRWKSIGND